MCHLTRKGPLLKKTNCCVISQERECSLNQTKTPIKSVATDHKMRVDLWNLVTTGGMALRLEILIAGRFCITPKRGQAVLQRIFKHFSYCPGDSTRSVQWVMIQDKQGRVLRSSVLDHSWTPFNQRPSDSRNRCRTREEPLKPCQEIVFQQHVVLFDGDKIDPKLIATLQGHEICSRRG